MADEGGRSKWLSEAEGKDSFFGPMDGAIRPRSGAKPWMAEGRCAVLCELG